MAEKPPKMFMNNPIEQHEKAKEAIMEVVKEEEKQEKIKEGIEEVENPPPTREQWMYWIVIGIMGIFIFIQNISPVVTKIRYSYLNSKEIQFTKDHPEYTTIMMNLYDKAHIKADTDLKTYVKTVDDMYK